MERETKIVHVCVCVRERERKTESKRISNWYIPGHQQKQQCSAAGIQWLSAVVPHQDSSSCCHSAVSEQDHLHQHHHQHNQSPIQRQQPTPQFYSLPSPILFTILPNSIHRTNKFTKIKSILLLLVSWKKFPWVWFIKQHTLWFSSKYPSEAL